MILPISISQVAAVTYLGYHTQPYTQLVFELGSHELLPRLALNRDPPISAF
jgi:hypothetical protein